MDASTYKGTNVNDIIKKLPLDQFTHICNVKQLVSTLSDLLDSSAQYLQEATPEEVKLFGMAAFYHDIGKVCVPPEILSKPGKLTLQEYRIIQSHTRFADKLFVHIRAGDITGMTEELIPLAHDSSVYHHEWWNGKGYPYGISGKDIPLVARVTSICDAYDAMVNNRSYRLAHSHDYACEEIKKGAGTQFEKGLVDIFLKYEHKFNDLVLPKASVIE
ncbi:HD-GYP domain-containing protein [Scatolibacter rhodanostii]|uniref:HD-GYP domain-containing protein n=1 Tax=Scatolibacter rhodanostii TaxID=2014781 RepID=UPI000C0807E1|nr:HD domain-containing phosphohydrolase [Scatolibacter rhodanostii]